MSEDLASIYSSCCPSPRVSYDLFRQRVNREGWSTEKALYTPGGNKGNGKPGQLIPFRGGMMLLQDIIKYFNILNLDPQTIYKRVVRAGWDIEKALNTPVGKRSNKIKGLYE